MVKRIPTPGIGAYERFLARALRPSLCSHKEVVLRYGQIREACRCLREWWTTDRRHEILQNNISRVIYGQTQPNSYNQPQAIYFETYCVFRYTCCQIPYWRRGRHLLEHSRKTIKFILSATNNLLISKLFCQVNSIEYARCAYFKVLFCDFFINRKWPRTA